jgi:2-keto-3-deoxy-L-fuconate dehydrogenase
MLLKDRISLVTGSTHNIGLGIARAFAREGAKVIVHSRHEEDAKKIAGEIKGDYFVADVARPAQLARLFGHIRKQHGGLDILVNSVAHSMGGGVLDVSLDEWNRIMTINLTGYFLCVQHAGKIMKKKGAEQSSISPLAQAKGRVRVAPPIPYPKARSIRSPAKQRWISHLITSESMGLSPVSSAHR